jgi:predicted O-methyltransferase YrrM
MQHNNRKFYLSERQLSLTFWSSIEAITSKSSPNSWLSETIIQSNHHRSLMAIQTGSISIDSMLDLYSTARYFQSSRIFEIGTYIGRSTLSLASGAGLNLDFVYTCDLSNDTWTPPTTFKDKISYFGKKSSSDTIATIKSEGKRFDTVYVDGRLNEYDLANLTTITTPDVIFILDDFEGTEKGVQNAFNLRNVYRNHLLIRPVISDLNQRRNTAVLIPSSVISLTHQQELPYSSE